MTAPRVSRAGAVTLAGRALGTVTRTAPRQWAPVTLAGWALPPAPTRAAAVTALVTAATATEAEHARALIDQGAAPEQAEAAAAAEAEARAAETARQAAERVTAARAAHPAGGRWARRRRTDERTTP